eukprot:403334934
MIVLGSVLSFSIGSNETDALATTYSSGSLSLKQCLLLGGIFEFIGAFYCSKQVSTTLSQNIILNFNNIPLEIQKSMMLSVTISTVGFTILSSVMGFPISGTHSMVGALLGAGLIGVGISNLNSTQLQQIVLSWFLSPLVSASLTCIILVFVCKYILNHQNFSFKVRMTMASTLSGIAFSTILILTSSLIFDKMFMLQGWNSLYLLVSFYAGFAYSRLAILNHFNKLQKDEILTSIFKPWSTDFIETLVPVARFEGAKESLLSQLSEEDRQNKQRLNFYRSLSTSSAYIGRTERSETIISKGSQKDLVLNSNNYQELQMKNERSPSIIIPQAFDKYYPPHETKIKTLPLNIKTKEIIEEQLTIVFKYLNIITTFQFCIANGSHNIANSITPLLSTFKIFGYDQEIVYLIGSITMALGLMTLGGRVLETIGKKVIQLDYQKGFCSQFATSISIMVGSYMGLPLSSTHCSIGSLIGLSLANYFTSVQKVYPDSEQKPENQLNFKVMGKIFAWWIVTIPFVFCTTAFLTQSIIG